MRLKEQQGKPKTCELCDRPVYDADEHGLGHCLEVHAACGGSGCWTCAFLGGEKAGRR